MRVTTAFNRLLAAHGRTTTCGRRLRKRVHLGAEPGSFGRPLTLVGSLSVGEEGGLVGVKQWAEVRRMHWVDSLSAREIGRRTGLARDTVARLLAAPEPPKYERQPVRPFQRSPLGDSNPRPLPYHATGPLRQYTW